jgi:hypothetical protein
MPYKSKIPWGSNPPGINPYTLKAHFAHPPGAADYPTPNPARCIEHFHQPEDDEQYLGECLSTKHPTHWVCRGCVLRVMEKGPLDEKKFKDDEGMLTRPEREVIQSGAVAYLCEACSDVVVDHIGYGYGGCECPTNGDGLERPWCFECKKTMAWHAPL